MSKAERDAKYWTDNPPPVDMNAWARIPIPYPSGASAVYNPWELLPEEIDAECNRPIFVEWRPSSIMGWGMAAIWYGPPED